MSILLSVKILIGPKIIPRDLKFFNNVQKLFVNLIFEIVFGSDLFLDY